MRPVSSTPPAGAGAPIIGAPLLTTPVDAASAVTPDFNPSSFSVTVPLSPTIRPSRSPSPAADDALADIEFDIGEPGATGPSFTFDNQPPAVINDDDIEYCTPSPLSEPHPLPSIGEMDSQNGSADAGDVMDWEDENLAGDLEGGDRRLEGRSQRGVERVDWRSEGQRMVDMEVQDWEELEKEGDRSGRVGLFGTAEDDLCSVDGSDIEEIFPGE